MRSHLSVLLPLLLVKSWVIQCPCFFSGIIYCFLCGPRFSTRFYVHTSAYNYFRLSRPILCSSFVLPILFLPLTARYHQFSSHIVDFALRHPDSWFSPFHIYILACLPKIHEEHTVYSALGTNYIHYILLLHPCIQIPQLHSWSTCNFTDFVNIGLAPLQSF